MNKIGYIIADVAPSIFVPHVPSFVYELSAYRSPKIWHSLGDNGKSYTDFMSLL